MTKTTVRAAVATITILAPLLSLGLPAAAAAPYFSSCDKLTAKWPNGVAKGPAAAAFAVRQGYSRPATSKLAVQVYWSNYTRLDRDRDGVACEN